jgi:hypothetical protein
MESMTLQAVHAGNQAIYVGNEGRLAFTIRDRSTGFAADLTASGLNLSRAVFHLAGRTVDSDVFPAAFDWTTGGANGHIAIDLTGFGFPSGSFGARLVLYCLEHPNGLVVADGHPVDVGQALVGTIPTQADVNTLFASLAGDGAGQGSDRVAWAGQTPSKTVSAGLAGLAADQAAHLSDTAAHGADGAVVGTMNAQTLSNKTLAGPVVNDPTVNATGWANANHDHSHAAKGGTLPKTALESGCFATQAEQETAAATDVAVSPGRQHYHPSAAKAWVRFRGTTQMGTYSQTGNTITCNILGHSLALGFIVSLDFTSGSSIDGHYTVSTVQNTNTFTILSATTQITSGNVTINMCILTSYNIATITDYATGDYSVNYIMPFTSANYVTVLTMDKFFSELNNSSLAANIHSISNSFIRFIAVQTDLVSVDADYVSVVAFGDQ